MRASAGKGRVRVSSRSPQARPGNVNAVSHGARSDRAVTRRAGYEKQRLTQRLGIRQSELAPPLRYRFDEWAKAQALVWLYDQWIAEHGALDAEGQPPAFSATHQAARNSASRLFAKVEADLLEAAKAKSGDPIAGLIAEGRKIREAREAREGKEPDA